MGMDVNGRKPTSQEGEYFRNSVWGWHPLANYIEHVAPNIAAKCDEWHSNSGEGLNADDSIRLADILDEEIRRGRTKLYELQRNGDLEMQPDEPCSLCEGTGTRNPPPQGGAGDPKKDGIQCNSCDGKGTVRPMATYYLFEVDNVANFAKFLRHSGGFNIY